jgi:hypothetical protein
LEGEATAHEIILGAKNTSKTAFVGLSRFSSTENADKKIGRKTNITKDRTMNLKDWEATIQQIVAESNHEPKEAGKHKVLNAWRAKLEREPTSLPAFRIDEIVREVRSRLHKVLA